MEDKSDRLSEFVFIEKRRDYPAERDHVDQFGRHIVETSRLDTTSGARDIQIEGSVDNALRAVRRELEAQPCCRKGSN
jgi:hypothetical protein